MTDCGFWVVARVFLQALSTLQRLRAKASESLLRASRRPSASHDHVLPPNNAQLPLEAAKHAEITFSKFVGEEDAKCSDEAESGRRLERRERAGA